MWLVPVYSSEPSLKLKTDQHNDVDAQGNSILPYCNTPFLREIIPVFSCYYILCFFEFLEDSYLLFSGVTEFSVAYFSLLGLLMAWVVF